MNGKIGNQTNSQDPQAVNSRVFVGNLNTFHCTKPDVEGLFQKYGRIAGISMHKGYAFIQFTNPFDARSACLGEDGRSIWDQTLDVNLVAEPKPIHTGRKRHPALKAANPNDCLKLQLESIYRNYYSQLGFPTPRLVPPIKRPRFRVTNDTHNHRTPDHIVHNNSISEKQPLINGPSNGNDSCFSDLKTYSTPDILICGNCREMFSEIMQLVEHKKTYCKLRFTCKCHVLNGYVSYPFEDKNTSLLCSQCKSSFKSAWDLMVHVQTKHLLNIYQVNSVPLDNNNADKSLGTEDENEMKGESNIGTDIESSSSRSCSIDSGEDHISFASTFSNHLNRQHNHPDTKDFEKETMMDVVREDNRQGEAKSSTPIPNEKESCYTATPFISNNGENVSHSTKTTSQGLMDVFQLEQHVMEASTQTPLTTTFN